LICPRYEGLNQGPRAFCYLFLPARRQQTSLRRLFF